MDGLDYGACDCGVTEVTYYIHFCICDFPPPQPAPPTRDVANVKIQQCPPISRIVLIWEDNKRVPSFGKKSRRQPKGPIIVTICIFDCDESQMKGYYCKLDEKGYRPFILLCESNAGLDPFMCTAYGVILKHERTVILLLMAFTCLLNDINVMFGYCRYPSTSAWWVRPVSEVIHKDLSN